MKTLFTYRLILLTGFLLLQVVTFRVAAQKLVVAGIVADTRGKPLGQVEVRCNEQSVYTAPDGRFSMEVIAFPATVQFYDVNHYERTAIAANPVSDTAWLVIQLIPLETDLDEVVITADRVQWVYQKKNVHIIDFEVQSDGGLLLLCKDKKDYFLRLTDAEDETIFELEIREHPLRFFTDCMGEKHVVYRDSAYQIEREDQKLSLMDGLLWQKVRDAYSDCVLANDRMVYLREFGAHKRSAWFYQYDSFSDKRKLLYAVYNRKATRELDEYYAQALAEKGGEELIHANDTGTLRRYRHAHQQLLFYEHVLSKPLYLPVFQFNKKVLLFDHLNDSLVVFNASGTQVNKVPITHHMHKKWAGEILTDHEHERFFALLKYDGMARLMEVDPETGETGREIPLDKHIYPTKIQIQGNYIYYLFHHYIDNSINYIYRQRID